MSPFCTFLLVCGAPASSSSPVTAPLPLPLPSAELKTGSLTAVAQAAPLPPRGPPLGQPGVQRLDQRLRQVLRRQRPVVPVEDREHAQVRRQGLDGVRLGSAGEDVPERGEVLALRGDERAQRGVDGAGAASRVRRVARLAVAALGLGPGDLTFCFFIERSARRVE